MPTELEILLGRPARRFDLREARERVRGRTVLVTGAAGSIGRALVREIAAAGPARLVLLDASEHGLHRLELRLGASPAGRWRTVLADLLDPVALEAALAPDPPDIVLHAAAFKHVALLERHPLAVLRNNVLGTLRLVRALERAGTRHLLSISTDKAVRPSGIMGASKRLVELTLLARPAATAPCWSGLRLGNVLGSRGSVLPRLRQSLSRGWPLAVTDVEAARFFLMPREAARFALAALVAGRGGDLLVPELGAPLPIVELARRLLRLGGHVAGAPEPIEFVGLAPGEKRVEELHALPERLEPTGHAGLHRIVAPPPTAPTPDGWLPDLERALERGHATAAVEVVCRALPEYRPSAALREALGRDAHRAVR